MRHWMASPIRLLSQDLTEEQCQKVLAGLVSAVCKKYSLETEELNIIIANPEAVDHPLIKYAVSNGFTLIEDATFGPKNAGLTIKALLADSPGELDKAWAQLRLRSQVNEDGEDNLN